MLKRKACIDRTKRCDIAKRFPKGGHDPLAGQFNIGNSFRSVNSLDFRLVKTGTMLPRK